MAAVRRGMRWAGPVGPSLVAHLSGSGTGHVLPALAFEDPIRWALETLEFAAPNGSGNPPNRQVQQRFRALLRMAHPDHGGDVSGAAQRIADLREARRILLAT
jgi:hypothetical protein